MLPGNELEGAQLSEAREMVDEIISAGLSAATSSNLQGVTVIRVRNPETRARIAEVAGGQAYVESAPAFFVWCADLHRSATACESDGGTFSPGMTEHFIIATVDTALAHLAGAMGKPVWVAVPFAPDWRWMRNTETSPWYPSMRLFRQKRHGAWAGVFGDIRRALALYFRCGVVMTVAVVALLLMTLWLG